MSRRTREIATVDAWYSPDCDTTYSVSLCEDDGDEIDCIGGANDADEAWEMALAAAKEHGVKARLMPDESGRVTREETPDHDA